MNGRTLRERFLEGMSRAASTVSVVTTDGPAGRAGVTVSAMTSLSLDTPSPSLLVCVHQDSASSRVIRENGVFCVNLLRNDQAQLSDVFASRVRTPSGDKFEACRWRTLATGSPVLEHALAAFDCHLRQATLYGTHWILIGELAEILLNEAGSPLLYANRTYNEPVPIDDPGAG
jgi:flavin reductase (DIM6/NTAB) family NADH-FMN oxidoreductase RutF